MFRIKDSPTDQSFTPDAIYQLRGTVTDSSRVRVHRVGPGSVAVEFRKGKLIYYAQVDAETARQMAAALLACADAPTDTRTA